MPASALREDRPLPTLDPRGVRRRPEAWERRLADRLVRREADALPELYERFGRHIFNFLLVALRDRGTAEDVQQQVFLEAWLRAEAYDSRRASLSTWLTVIARSRAIDQQRRRVPEPIDEARVLAPAGADVDRERELDALVESWRVAGLLGRLPTDEAALLRMRFYEDLPQTEISERTGIPLGTVKMRMAQGLRRLRGLMDEEPEHD